MENKAKGKTNKLPTRDVTGQNYSLVVKGNSLEKTNNKHEAQPTPPKW